MGRPNYMTISVADTIQDMFNEFILAKNITKTSALNDVIEMYMIAKDEELYLNLKKKYLNVESVINMIADRDCSTTNQENEFLFMKLGTSITVNGDTLDGEETIQAYKKDEDKNGYTWFSTKSLYYGMSKDKIKYYNNKINNGHNLKILFALNDKNIDNDIAYIADILEIYSDKLPVKCPEACNPVEFGPNETAKIWLKIKNIKNANNLNASMLKIISTGRDLKQTISRSQYHFGYVTYK